MSDGILLLKPRKWEDFQHYKDRCPPWIKLHRELLSNREFMRLPTASKALAPLLWLLASESKSKDGQFDASTEELEFRLHMSTKDIESGRKSLIDKGFFVVASTVLAECLQVAIPETEGETEKRERTETDISATPKVELFEEFWKAYPKKKAKDDAKKAFDKRKPDRQLLTSILSAIALQSRSDDWMKDGGKFIPYPATWLNDGRWMDGEAVELAPVIRGPDPALQKILADDKKAAPVPENIREQLSALRFKFKEAA